MKYAIIFSAENRVERNVFDANNSSPFEKMSIALAYSIRKYSDADVYCGSFTTNKLSAFARLWFHRLKVKVVEDVKFDTGVVSLRTYTKHYFRHLLDRYGYLIYIDIDAIAINKIEFDFDPSSPLVLTCTMPQWVKNYHKQYLGELQGNLYYNWVDIINKHNVHLFELDEGMELTQHNLDVIISNRIENSSLPKIEMDFGGYLNISGLNERSIFHHYDHGNEEGCMYLMKDTHPQQLADIVSFFDKELRMHINPRSDYWTIKSKDYE